MSKEVERGVWRPIEEYTSPVEGVLRDCEDTVILSDGAMVWVAEYDRYVTETWEQIGDGLKQRTRKVTENWRPYPRGAREISWFMRLPAPPKEVA